MKFSIINKQIYINNKSKAIIYSIDIKIMTILKNLHCSYHFIINRLRCKLREINIPIENFFNIFPKKIHEFSERKKKDQKIAIRNEYIYIHTLPTYIKI